MTELETVFLTQLTRIADALEGIEAAVDEIRNEIDRVVVNVSQSPHHTQWVVRTISVE